MKTVLNSVKLRKCHGDIYVWHSSKPTKEQVCVFEINPQLNIFKLCWPAPDRMAVK